MIAIIKKQLDALISLDQKLARFLSYILIPLWVLTVYFLFFSRVLPAGINNNFASRSGKYALLLASFLTLFFIFMVIIKREKVSFIRGEKKPFDKGNLFLILLPLIVITQYVLNNFEILSFAEIVYIFVVFSSLTAFFVVAIPTFLQRVSSHNILISIGLAFSFVIIEMAELSQRYSWHEKGSLKVQLLLFLGVFLLSSLFLYTKNQKNFYAIIIIMFLTTGITQLSRNSISIFAPSEVEIENDLLNLAESNIPENTPGIYLLIYDAYVSNETMLSYGFSNQPQEEYLKSLDFKLYPNTYSIGSFSVNTMSRVLNASTEYYGKSRRAVSGDGVVQNLLQGFGYQTYGIFPYDYFFRGIKSSYDYAFPKYKASPAELLIRAILIGEFQFDLMFDLTQEEFISEKMNIFSEQIQAPKFIYMHSSKPGHSQNSGKCMPDATETYYENLQEANIEMKRDIETLLKNDPNSIIIIAGDHGPYLTKNCAYTSEKHELDDPNYYDISEISRLDIQDRFGTFLAIRWPTQDFEPYDDIVVLQDLFPSVFAYMFQSENLLDAKVAPITLDGYAISEARVVDGIIEGGIHDGEPLFLGAKE